MEEQRKKDRLTARLGEEHQRLRQLLSGLSPAQWTTLGASGEWSVKDILAHVIAREQNALQGLELARRGMPQAREYKDLDSFNSRVVEDNRSRPAEELMEVWDESFKKVLSAAAQLKEEDFSAAGPVAQALGGSPEKVLKNSTYGHYAERRIQIEKWLSRPGSPR